MAANGEAHMEGGGGGGGGGGPDDDMRRELEDLQLQMNQTTDEVQYMQLILRQTFE